MRAWQLDDSPGELKLAAAEVSDPTPGKGEVLIRVHAAGVTPSELLWQPTTHSKTGKKRKHAIPGHEFSGSVAAVGKDVVGVSLGQDVFGLNDWFDQGATAEYCLTRPEWIAAKPKRLSHVEAASAPISALTAWQGLFDRAKLQAGERVLIHGGSGGVGIFAVQLASRHLAQVITTASARNAEFLRQHGARQVIDYHSEKFEEIVKDIDVVFDTVGGETLKKSWSVLSDGGRVVTVASNSEGADKRAKKAFFIVEPNRAQLIMIGDLLEAGELKPFVDAVVPFTQAGDAYAGKIEKRVGRGKVVIVVD